MIAAFTERAREGAGGRAGAGGGSVLFARPLFAVLITGSQHAPTFCQVPTYISVSTHAK